MSGMSADRIPISRKESEFGRLPAFPWRRFLTGVLFVSPWLIGVLAFTIYPMAASLYYSFTRYRIVKPPEWVGVQNYVQIFTTDRDFPIVVRNTLWWAALSPVLGVVSAFLLASLLNARLLGRSMFRAIFYFPSIVPSVVTAFVWQFLLNVQYGAINATLKGWGLRAIPFLSSPRWVKPTLLLISMWSGGSAMIIFLAALQDVPRVLYEAATVDGASAWRKFWHVTIPMCSPAILFNLVTSFIYAFQSFTMAFLISGGDGSPDRATLFYVLHLWRNAFTYDRMGKACAMAWVLFVFIMALTILLFRWSRQWVYYAGEAG